MPKRIMAAKRISMSCHRDAWDGMDKYVRETVRSALLTSAVLRAEGECQDSRLPEVMRCLTMPPGFDAVWCASVSP